METHGIIFEGTGFHVRHRRKNYGLFDYQWSRDLAGIELLYQGEKFGELCSAESIYADLCEYKLPTSVVHVASLTLGVIIQCFTAGEPYDDRIIRIGATLCKHGFQRFAHFDGPSAS